MSFPQLHNRTKHHGALRQIELGARAVAAGLDVEFEPPVGRKRADLRIGATPELYVEVKVLHSGIDATDQEATHGALLDACRNAPDQTEISGSIERSLSTPRCQEVVSRLRSAIKRVHAGDPMQHVEIPGICSFEVSRSAGVTGTRMTIRGPTPPDEGMRRVRQHIRDAGKGQLPADRPSLLVIDCNPCWPSVSMEQPGFLARELQEYVCEHKNLVAVALVSEHISPGEQGYVDDESSIVFDRRIDGLRDERMVVVRNPYSAHKSALGLVQQILMGAASLPARNG